MRSQQQPQPVTPPVEQPLGADQAAHRPRQLRGWRTVKELTEELRFPSAKACRSWLSRSGIASVRRGRVILVSGVDIDRALRGRG